MPTRNNEAKVWKQRRTVSKKIATYKNTDINNRFACHIWPSCQSKKEATNGSNPHLKGVVVYDRLLAGPRRAIDDEVFSTSFHLPVFILALPNVSLKFRRMKFTQFCWKKNCWISFSIQKKRQQNPQTSVMSAFFHRPCRRTGCRKNLAAADPSKHWAFRPSPSRCYSDLLGLEPLHKIRYTPHHAKKGYHQWPGRSVLRKKKWHCQKKTRWILKKWGFGVVKNKTVWEY